MTAASLLTQMKCNYCRMLRSQLIGRYKVSHMYRQLRQKSTKTHYEVLRVAKNASPSDIKKAFLKLSKETHPDKGGGKHSDFVLVNEAYTVLKDPVSRNVYDERTFGHAGRGVDGMSGAGRAGGAGRPTADPQAYHRARQRYENMQEDTRYQQDFHSDFREAHGHGIPMVYGGFFNTMIAICGIIFMSKVLFFALVTNSPHFDPMDGPTFGVDDKQMWKIFGQFVICSVIIYMGGLISLVFGHKRRRDTYSEMHGNHFEQYPHRRDHTMLYRDDRLYSPHDTFQHGPAIPTMRDLQPSKHTPDSAQDKPRKRRKKRENTETDQISPTEPILKTKS